MKWRLTKLITLFFVLFFIFPKALMAEEGCSSQLPLHNYKPDHVCEENSNKIPLIKIESNLSDKAPHFVDGVAKLKQNKKIHYSQGFTYTPDGKNIDDTLTIEQALSANERSDGSGLTFLSYHKGPWRIPAEQTPIANITLEGQIEESYTITTTITAQPSGRNEVLVEKIEIINDFSVVEQTYLNTALSIKQRFYPINKDSKIEFEVGLYGFVDLFKNVDTLSLFEVTKDGQFIEKIAVFSDLKPKIFEDGKDYVVEHDEERDYKIAYLEGYDFTQSLEINKPQKRYYQLVAFDEESNILEESSIRAVVFSSFYTKQSSDDIVTTEELNDSLVYDRDDDYSPEQQYFTYYVNIGIPDTISMSEERIYQMLEHFNLEVAEAFLYENHTSLVVFNPYKGNFEASKNLTIEIEAYHPGIDAYLDAFIPNPFGAADVFVPNEYLSINVK